MQVTSLSIALLRNAWVTNATRSPSRKGFNSFQSKLCSSVMKRQVYMPFQGTLLFSSRVFVRDWCPDGEQCASLCGVSVPGFRCEVCTSWDLSRRISHLENNILGAIALRFLGILHLLKVLEMLCKRSRDWFLKRFYVSDNTFIQQGLNSRTAQKREKLFLFIINKNVWNIECLC